MLRHGQLECVRCVDLAVLVVLAHGGPPLEAVSWRTPNTYLRAGVERGTATSSSTRPGTTSPPGSHTAAGAAPPADPASCAIGPSHDDRAARPPALRRCPSLPAGTTEHCLKPTHRRTTSPHSRRLGDLSPPARTVRDSAPARESSGKDQQVVRERCVEQRSRSALPARRCASSRTATTSRLSGRRTLQCCPDRRGQRRAPMLRVAMALSAGAGPHAVVVSLPRTREFGPGHRSTADQV
jgi:hypothetical protein